MSTERYIQLFENLAAGVSITNPEGKIIEANNALVKILGYKSKEELLSNSVINVYYDQNDRKKFLDKLKKGPVKNFRIKGVKNDGSIVWLSVTSNPVYKNDGNLEFIDIVEDITEQVQTKKELIEKDKLIQLLSDATNEAIFLSENGKCLNQNKTARRMLGYSSKEAIGKLITEWIHPDFRDTLMQNIISKNKKPFEAIALRKDGSTFHAEIQFKKTTFQGKNLNITALRDISGQKEAQTEKIRSDEKYKAVVEHQTEFICRWKPDGTRIFVNKAYADYYNKSPEEIIGTSFVKDIDINSWDKLITRISKLNINNPVSYNISKSEKNGTTVWKEWTDRAFFDKNGIIYEIQSIGRDVTKRKLAEQNLIESEERYRALFEQSSDPTLLLENWTFTECNNAAVSFLKYKSAKQIIGKTPWDLSPEFQPDGQKSIEKAKKLISDTIENGNNRFIWNHIDSNGDVYFVDVSLTLIPGHKKRIYTVWRDITSQRISEQHLLENEALLRATLESTRDGILVVNHKGKVTHFNNNFFKMWNVPENLIKKINDKALLKYVISQLKNPNEFLRKVKQLYKSNDQDYDIIEFKDGKLFERTSYPLIINDSIEGRVWNFYDITELKKSEKALHESQQNLEMIYDTAGVGLFRIGINSNGNFILLSVNNTYLQLTGRKIENIINREIDKIFSPESIKVAKEKYRQALETKETVSWEETNEFSGILKIGSLSITPVFDENDKCTSLVGVIHDITEKKEFEAKIIKSQEELEKLVHSRTIDLEKSRKAALNLLQDSNESRKKAEEAYRKLEDSLAEIRKLSLAVEQNPATVVITDLDGVIEYVNQNFTKTTGYQPDEITGIKPKIKIIENTLHKNRQDIWAHIRNGETWNGEIENTRKNGEIYWESVSISPIFDEQNRIVNFVKIGQDITERKKLEVDLMIAKEKADEATKAKSEFLANMSHEIRTPMNAILGFADLLSIRVTDNQAQNYIQSLKTSGKSLLNLINDILDLSKVEAGMMHLFYEFIDLRILFKEIEQIFSLSTKEKKLDLKIQVDPSIPESIFLDEARLRQVLINLVSNAVKFTEKGYIKISAEVNNYEEKQYNKNTFSIDLIIKVEDTGVGIPDNFQTKIFDSFIQHESHDTKKYGGTGLGLAISHKLVKLMNGSLSVESSVGKGSIFSVTLNNTLVTDKPMVHEKSVDLNINEIKFKPSKILLVDDEPNNLVFLTGILEHVGLNIKTANNGREAISSIKENVPDLLITDIRMPVMGGIDLLKFIRSSEKYKNIPVLSASASVMKESTIKLKEYGFDGSLNKPIQIPELLNELIKHIPYEGKPPTASRQKSIEFSVDSLSNIELKKVNNQIEQVLLPQWEQIKNRQPIKKVEAFSKTLIKIGKQTNTKVFIEYGNEIENALKSFNVELMVKLIKYFPKIIKNLKK